MRREPPLLHGMAGDEPFSPWPSAKCRLLRTFIKPSKYPRRYASAMRIAGFSCTPRQAYVAVSNDGIIEESSVERLDVAAQHEASQELLATRDDVRRLIREVEASKVVLLQPEERQPRNPGYQELVPRIALETVIRLAAVEDGVDVELLPRPTVRARLGLPKSGSLDSHVEKAVKDPVGRYWNQGRGVAALAALSAEG